MCDARLWRPQLDAIDLPSSVADMTSADNIPDLARCVLAEAPDEFAAVGLSMGGILAFELWRQAPERITHLALLDTNPHADSAERQSMRVRQLEEVASGRLRQLAIESLKPAYLAQANRDDETLLDTILQMAMDLGDDVFRLQTLALKQRQDSVPTLATIDCPTAVICGSEDTLCPVFLHELMAHEIHAADLTIIEKCGHLSSLEQPADTNTALMRLFAH